MHMAVSPTHVLYIAALVGWQHLLHGRCEAFAIFNHTEVVISEATLPRLFASAVALSASEVLHTSTTPSWV